MQRYRGGKPVDRVSVLVRTDEFVVRIEAGEVISDVGYLVVVRVHEVIVYIVISDLYMFGHPALERERFVCPGAVQDKHRERFPFRGIVADVAAYPEYRLVGEFVQNIPLAVYYVPLCYPGYRITYPLHDAAVFDVDVNDVGEPGVRQKRAVRIEVEHIGGGIAVLAECGERNADARGHRAGDIAVRVVPDLGHRLHEAAGARAYGPFGAQHRERNALLSREAVAEIRRRDVGIAVVQRIRRSRNGSKCRLGVIPAQYPLVETVEIDVVRNGVRIIRLAAEYAVVSRSEIDPDLVVFVGSAGNIVGAAHQNVHGVPVPEFVVYLDIVDYLRLDRHFKRDIESLVFSGNVIGAAGVIDVCGIEVPIEILDVYRLVRPALNAVEGQGERPGFVRGGSGVVLAVTYRIDVRRLRVFVRIYRHTRDYRDISVICRRAVGGSFNVYDPAEYLKIYLETPFGDGALAEHQHICVDRESAHHIRNV